MSLHSDLLYLADMRDAARKVSGFTEGIEYEDFLGNEEKQWAVMHGIEIIGEASNKVSAEFVTAHPDFSWKQMYGMRNLLIHGYADVDLKVVWDVVKDDLPGLIEKLEQVLGKEPEDPPQASPESDKKAPAHHLPSRRRPPQTKREGPDLDR